MNQQNNAVMPPRFYVANRLIDWLMRRVGIVAVATPWMSVYILWEWSARRDIWAHERVHLDQIQRIGPVKFTILYFWYLALFGYENNPFEIEAYAKAPIH